MPVIAAPLFWSAVVGGGSALAGGALAAHASGKSADAQVQAENQAAQLQKQAADNTLAFEKEQAANSRADSIAAQNANYGQFAYRQNTIRPYQGSGLAANNTLAQLLGLPPQNTTLPDLPATPNFSNSGQPSAPASGGSSPAVDGSASSISAYFKSKGAPDTETPYWVKEWPNLVARGKELGNPNYPMERLADADIFGKAAAPVARNLGSYAGMPPVAPTPLGTGTTLPFIPMTLGSYASGAA